MTPPAPTASLAAAWFIAGTDTGIGKTFSTCALLQAARNQGLRALGMKPVAAGAERVDGVLLNEDVAALRAAGSFDPGLERLNPWCFAAPIAPHIAAAEEGRRVEPAPVVEALAALRRQADVVFVEGVGGFKVPLAEDYDSADLAVELALPVILVVGLRLGCLSHALLTVEAITHRGLTLAGWIGNCVDPEMLRREQNVEALRQRIAAPLLGLLQWTPGGSPADQATALTLPR